MLTVSLLMPVMTGCGADNRNSDEVQKETVKDVSDMVHMENAASVKELMDAAEKVAAQYSDMVYLGVGLHEGYGSAQRMYVKRGYIPDGTGVWYGEKVCPQYADCCNDDDLVLYFSKALNKKKRT